MPQPHPCHPVLSRRVVVQCPFWSCVVTLPPDDHTCVSTLDVDMLQHCTWQADLKHRLHRASKTLSKNQTFLQDPPMLLPPAERPPQPPCQALGWGPTGLPRSNDNKDQ